MKIRKSDEKRIKELEWELNRKDKALAETGGLLKWTPYSGQWFKLYWVIWEIGNE